MWKTQHRRARAVIASFTVGALVMAATPAGAEVNCLTDDEIRVLVRSAFTRSIGRVMRICADTHPALDERAVAATTDFLTAYAEPMRRNRTAANALMARIYQNWEQALAQLLARAAAGDEAWARTASEGDCLGEIARVEDMVAAGDYHHVMTTPRTERQFETERANVPRCE